MAMRIAEEFINVVGPIELIWDKVVGWKNWPSWDHGMESITFSGSLQVNAHGNLKLKDGPKVTLVITELTPLRSYTSEFSFLGTRFVFGHFLTEGNSADIVQFRVTADVDGFSAPLLANISKPKLTKHLPIWLNNFKAQFENPAPSLD
ncbi:MAG TPA: hypothetical protein V6C97_17720 [Oculatellaceae cyanobacterium]